MEIQNQVKFLVPNANSENDLLIQNLSVSGTSGGQRRKPRNRHFIGATRRSMLTETEEKYYLQILKLQRLLKKEEKIKNLEEENKNLKKLAVKSI